MILVRIMANNTRRKGDIMMEIPSPDLRIRIDSRMRGRRRKGDQRP